MKPIPHAIQAQAPVPEIDIPLLRRYHERIVTIAVRMPQQVTAATLLSQVLSESGLSAVSERVADHHRAALLAAAFYVNGWRLEMLVPEARTWPRAERRSVTLRGRHDLAQHFTVSAFLSAFAGTALASMAGIYKEMDDARRGSGFSFSDLAADRAGTLLGELLTKSPESALRLRKLLASGPTENDLMPPVSGLPDNMSQAEFARRFGGVGAPAYNQQVDEIDKRIAALSLYR